jgi:hypothetical protein
MASPYLVIAFVVGGIAIAILAAASVDGSVCGNKINTPLHLADPPSFIPVAAPPRRHWDLLRSKIIARRHPQSAVYQLDAPLFSWEFADLVPI